MKNITLKGYIIGAILSAVILFIFNLSTTHYLRAPGEFNTGHENLSCNACHEETESTIRQQVQANLAYLIGNRKTLASFEFEFPDNTDCLDCHARENDHHPVYRFNEPRFLEVRQSIQPQYCASCHQEHQGVRVTSEPDNCQHCHEDIEVKNDPLDVSHADIIKLNNWDSCLGCHDFHGNHKMKTATLTKNMLKKSRIEEYFNGGKDPYSTIKITESKEKRSENK